MFLLVVSVKQILLTMQQQCPTMSGINFGLKVLDSMMKRYSRRGDSADTNNSDVLSFAADSTSSEVLPLAAILGGRAILLDLGHSSMKPIRRTLPLEKLDWNDVAIAQRETQAGLILLCGAHDGMQRLPGTFREWCYIAVDTDGSTMMALAHPDHWEVRGAAEKDSIELWGDRKALCLELRRNEHPWMTLVMLKMHLTPCSTGSSLNAFARDQIWQAITAELRGSSHWLLAGAPEANVNSVLKRLSCIDTDTQSTGSPRNHLQFIASGTDLVSATATASHVAVEQCLVLEIGLSAEDVEPITPEVPLRPVKKARLRKDSDDADLQLASLTADSSRSSVQPPASDDGCAEEQGNGQGNEQSWTVRDARSCFLRALREADEAGTDLPAFLFMPRAKVSWSQRDGSMLVHASSRTEFERKFAVAAMLMATAREDGARIYDDAILDENQFGWAWDWLNDLYKDKYMTWPGLEEALDAWHSGSNFDRTSKADMRSDTRKGFRSWIKQTVGSVPLARAWVKYGFSTRESVQRVLRELLEQQKKNEGTAGPKTRDSHPELARSAHDARKAWRHGRSLASKRDRGGRSYYYSLAAWEHELVNAFDSGALERAMIQANKAFGHGRGACMGLGLDELAVIEYHLRDSTKALDAYFNQ